MPICIGCGCHYSGDSCGVCEQPQKKNKVYQLPQKSEKRKQEEKEYLRLKEQFLKDNPNCAVYPLEKAVDVHHKEKRGKNYLKVETWLAVSRRAHREIEDNPKWAYQMGYSKKVNSKQ